MTKPAIKPAAPERPKFAPPPGGGRPGGGGPFGGGIGMPAEKSLNFVPSAKRLLRRMHPERIGLIFVVLLGVISVVFSVIGPRPVSTTVPALRVALNASSMTFESTTPTVTIAESAPTPRVSS